MAIELPTSMWRVISATIIVAMATGAKADTEAGRLAVEKAEREIAKVMDACKSDLKAFCSQVTPGDGRLAMCALAHEDKLTDACFSAMFDFADGLDLALGNIGRALEVCESDIEKLCAGVEAGDGRIAQCLLDNKAEVSTPCKAETSAIETRLKN
ncbi:MAG: cysteine rich repeat-containing protein [Hyphomicrobiaceae bacterium]